MLFFLCKLKFRYIIATKKGDDTLQDKKYKASNEQFERLLTARNISLKETYDILFLREIRQICRLIAPYQEHLFTKGNIDNWDIKTLFLEAIKNLEDKDIYDYYRHRINQIDIKPNTRGDVSLSLILINNLFYAESVSISNDPSEINAMSFAHEMGHIPCYENKDQSIEEYFEYIEVLPILFEYFMSLYLFEDKGKDKFLKERLSLEKMAASTFEYQYRKYLFAKKRKTQAEGQYLLYELADCYKYLTSLDFSLQLIDLMKEDKRELIKGLSKVVTGDASIKTIGEDFSIESTSCKRLVKEYKERIKYNE